MLRTFLHFPHPLALLDLQGATLLVNKAMHLRFGAVVIDVDRIRSLPAVDDLECRVALRPQGHSAPIEVPARAIRTDDRLLLVFGEAIAGGPTAELGRLRERVLQLEQIAATDFLTGAWNRAHFNRLIQIELAGSEASRRPVTLALIDIDHFKTINDTYGHAVGDSVLRELVEVIRSCIRASDVLFRWGGEEFAVLAASVGYRGAERLAEHIRSAVAAHVFRDVGTITVSVGVAEHAAGEDSGAWFERLDEALYSAKRGGRNRVVVDRRGDSDDWASATGSAVLSLVWQEAFECGEPTIDDEHREMFRLANRLIESAANAQAEPGQLAAALDALLAHVQQHFADEEAILERHGYADLEQHRRAHAGLLRRAAFLKAQAEEGKAKLGAVVEFLAQDVVARHMLAVDRAFYPLFAWRSAQREAGATA